VLQVGDLVRFYDYDAAMASYTRGDEHWRIGIVSEIRDEPWDEDWAEEYTPYPVIMCDGRTQPIIMPNERNIGAWVEVISESR
jgi:hypothetical protein|tara:strand:- start:243 stop:491 length:249 start_codon:yes stop_codon:yes gene_type:complete